MSETFESPKLIVATSLPRDPRLLVREHNRILNDTLREAAFEHHRRHISWHFEPFAAQKYGYHRRGRKYQALKDRLDLPPLVSPFSLKQGRLPTFMFVRASFEVTATPKRSTLKMRLPFGGGTGRLRIRGNALTDHQQALLMTIAEIEAIADDEQQYLNRFIGQLYTKKANAPGQKYRLHTAA
jgi:hypothetical protein